MDNEIREILNKMDKVIETASKHHKVAVYKFLSLANRRLYQLTNSENLMWIIGASAVLQEKCEIKFGYFDF